MDGRISEFQITCAVKPPLTAPLTHKRFLLNCQTRLTCLQPKSVLKRPDPPLGTTGRDLTQRTGRGRVMPNTIHISKSDGWPLGRGRLFPVLRLAAMAGQESVWGQKILSGAREHMANLVSAE